MKKKSAKALGAAVGGPVVVPPAGKPIPAAQLIRKEAFAALSWWDKLNIDEQQTVEHEGRGLAEALLNFGASRMAVGERLATLQEILEPHKCFVRFLQHFHFSQRTAYRAIRGYHNAKQSLPPVALQVASARGMNMLGESETKPLGIYTEAVKKLPPPAVQDVAKMQVWLDKVEALRKETARIPVSERPRLVAEPSHDRNLLLKEAYRAIHRCYGQLPGNSKTRANWVRDLVGHLLIDLGTRGPQTYSPVAIPEDFRAVRGRPRLVEGVAA